MGGGGEGEEGCCVGLEGAVRDSSYGTHRASVRADGWIWGLWFRFPGEALDGDAFGTAGGGGYTPLWCCGYYIYPLLSTVVYLCLCFWLGSRSVEIPSTRFRVYCLEELHRSKALHHFSHFSKQVLPKSQDVGYNQLRCRHSLLPTTAETPSGGEVCFSETRYLTALIRERRSKVSRAL